MITGVKAVSPAADANLVEGDVILEVDGVEVSSMDNYQREMKSLTKKDWVRFYVLRSQPRPQQFIAVVRLKAD